MVQEAYEAGKNERELRPVTTLQAKGYAKRLTPSKLVLTQTCGERGEIEISFVIGNIEEAVVESTREDKDRDVEERRKVLRW